MYFGACVVAQCWEERCGSCAFGKGLGCGCAFS